MRSFLLSIVLLGMKELAEEFAIFRAVNISISTQFTNLKTAVEKDQFSSPERTSPSILRPDLRGL